MIKIFTDSTSYINEDVRKALDISVLSLSVSIDDNQYIETEISNEEFFSLMDQSENFPKSSQPETDAILDAFRRTVINGDTVVGIFLSSKMSGTYSACNLAKDMITEEYPDANIHLVDSMSNCMQMGLAVVEAAIIVQNNGDIKSVLNATYDTMRRTRFLFIPHTLTYLEKGGRIGKASALLGNMLKLIPILTVIDGETNSMCKVRTHKKAIVKLLSLVKEDIDNYGLDKIVVGHINGPDMANDFIKMLKEITNKPVEITNIGPVIGVHVGPKTIGVIYKTLKPHPINACVTQ